jgi:hypothetical protein
MALSDEERITQLEKTVEALKGFTASASMSAGALTARVETLEKAAITARSREDTNTERLRRIFEARAELELFRQLAHEEPAPVAAASRNGDLVGRIEDHFKRGTARAISHIRPGDGWLEEGDALLTEALMRLKQGVGMSLVEELRRRAAEAERESTLYAGDRLCGICVGKSQAYGDAAKLVEADPEYTAGHQALELWRAMIALESKPMAEAIQGGMEISQKARPLLESLPKAPDP